MKTIINYIFLVATICYTSTAVLAAPIPRLVVPYQTSDTTSLDAREFGLSSSSEPLSMRMYNEVLNARTINAQTTETDLFSREPSMFATLLAKGKAYVENHPEHLDTLKNYLADSDNQAKVKSIFTERLPEHFATMKRMIKERFNKDKS